MALLLFVMMEMMLPWWEPSAHTGHGTVVRVSCAHHWQPECRPHVPPPATLGSFLCTRLPPARNLLQHSCWVWPMLSPRREQSTHGAGNPQPPCPALRVFRTALGGCYLCGLEALQHPSQSPQACWLPCMGAHSLPVNGGQGPSPVHEQGVFQGEACHKRPGLGDCHHLGHLPTTCRVSTQLPAMGPSNLDIPHCTRRSVGPGDQILGPLAVQGVPIAASLRTGTTVHVGLQSKCECGWQDSTELQRCFSCLPPGSRLTASPEAPL